MYTCAIVLGKKRIGVVRTRRNKVPVQIPLSINPRVTAGIINTQGYIYIRDVTRTDFNKIDILIYY